MPIALSQTNESRLLALARERTAVIIPVGMIEGHGPCLPVGLSLEHAATLSRRLADDIERMHSGWTLLLAPPAPVGMQPIGSDLALGVRPHVLRDYLVDVVRGLSRSGFIYFFCVSGTLSPRHLTAIEEAGRMLAGPLSGTWDRLFGKLLQHRRGLRFYSLSSLLVPRGAVFSAPLFPDPLEHGGRDDASLALAIQPDCVDPSYRALPSRERRAGWLARFWRRLTRKQDSYWGAPAEGNPELGQKRLDAEAKRILEYLAPLFERGMAPKPCSSGYSAFPLNWSFFTAWLLLIAGLSVMAAWVFITLRALPV